MLRYILTASRYLILIAVLGSLLASVLVLLYGGFAAVEIGIEIFSHPVFTVTGVKYLSISCVQVIDLFLLGTALYIIALGLSELFIDVGVPKLPWLVISNFDELKAKLIGVVIVLLIVTFLGNVVEWNNSPAILALGGSIALVLFGLAYFNRTAETHNSKKKEQNEEKGE